MATLLLAEVAGGQLNDATARALTAALELGAPVDVLVAGQNVGAAAETAAKLERVAKVLVADDPLYQHGLAEPLAALIVALAPGYDAIVAPSTASAKNVAPRAAALLDVMQISDITKVVGPKTFERPIYAGNAIQIVESTDPKIVVTVRTASFSATGQGGSASIEKVAAAPDPAVSSFVGEALAKSDRPGTGLGEDHHFRRPGDAESGEFQDLYRASGGQARRGDGRIPRCGGRGLRAQRLAGRSNRQGRRA